MSHHDNFSAPMPWIGRYIVAASLICILAMLADAVQGIRSRKFWLPCRFFTFNAASLTLLGVVVKLPLDLNNPMPGKIDQMAKLSSVVFMSTAMANFMPSLALMDNKDILMGMTALGILVITLVVNVCIELGTGIIYSEKTEHIVVMLSMVFLFVIMCFSALTVPTIKSYLELEYRERGNMIEIDYLVDGEKPVEVKLKENLSKFFVMAKTGNPQFVMARSATCAACCAICCLNCLLLLEVSFRDNLFDAHVLSMSDYRRSTYCISRIQSAGVAVGTVSSLIRWFAIATIKSSSKSISIKVERHWLERLKDWKDSPFALEIKNPKCRKLVQQIQNIILLNCIRVQILIVVASKIVQLFPILLLSLLRSCFYSSLQCNNIISSVSESAENLEEDISRYVLHLEGEEELTQVTANKRDDTTWMMEIGRKQQPKHLIELLQKLTDFRGVSKFDINQFQEPHIGWKMSIVTLTAIATTIPNIDHKMVDSLLLSVSQGLKYVSFIEDILGTNENSEKNKQAADVVWLELYLYRRWLDQDLQKMDLQGKTSKEILDNFADIAQDYATKDDYSRKLTEVIAGNSMYQMSQIILQDSEKIDDQTEVHLFNHISAMIASVLGAYLINMPFAITKKCSSNAIEMREENVQHAIRLLGETEEIIKFIQQHEKVTPTNSSNSDSDSSSLDEIRIPIE
ncbi:uncharacterized protein [Solanum tuberosum]|uniref:Uncharacterized protein n=1 Tax=Solanum tuberosum TaxID=4113 RepID=M1B2W5_SOLTU|nr:PREDICTED: uncharacterized protein LOC107058862 [Solanum tuberosum]